MHRLAIAASVAVVAAMCTNCAREQSSSSGNLLPSPSILAPSTVGGGDALTIGAEAKGGKGGGGGGTPTGGGGGSLSLVMVIDYNNDGGPNFKDTVTFNISTTATAYPYVTLKCYQNGTLVSDDTNAMFAGSLDQKFTLGPTGAWTSGAADCTATLHVSGSSTALASLAVPVAN